MTPVIGAEIRGVDLREPLAPEEVAAIERAFLERQVLFFHGPDVPVERLLDFGRHYGNVSLPPIAPPPPQHPDVMVFELVDPRGAGADGAVRVRTFFQPHRGYPHFFWHIIL